MAQAVKGQGTICWVDCGYVQETGHCGWRAGVRRALMGGVGNGSDWHSGKENLMEKLLQEDIPCDTLGSLWSGEGAGSGFPSCFFQSHPSSSLLT